MNEPEQEIEEGEPTEGPETDEEGEEGSEDGSELAEAQEGSQSRTEASEGKPSAAEIAQMGERKLAKLVEEGVLTPDEIENALERYGKEQEQILDKLDREAKRHRDRLAEILQEDVLALVPCELCRADLAGWVDRTVAIPDEVKVRTRIQIGDRQPENWQADRYSRQCDTCEGLGEVLTGSQVQGQTTLPCIACNGKGWVPVGDERRGNVVPVTFTPNAGTGEVQAPAAPANLPAIPPEIADAYVVIPKVR